MPARLSVHAPEGGEDVLRLKLGGDAEEFRAQLARAKSVPGRRYDPTTKSWDFPNTADSLLRIVHTIEPELSKELSERVQAAKAEAAEEIVTKLPDDAALIVPWRERLAPKQRAGVDFMAQHPHCLLCDDMGSGKTVQAISAVYEARLRTTGIKNADPGASGAILGGRFLVVAPNSVTRHWRREIQKWTGLSADKILVIDGATAPARKEQIEDALARGVEWFIVNWEKLQTRVGLIGDKKPAILDAIKWDAVVADEVHRAKNRKSQQGKGLRKLKADIQIGASGTPVMNNPGELFNLLQWLDPKTYTSYWAFFHTYTEFYEGYKGKPVVIGVKNADGLRFELADKMVRRTKREIHPDMQEPFDPIVYEIDMTKDQRKLYDEVNKQFWVDIAQEVKESALTAAEDLPGEADLAAVAQELEGAADLATLKLMVPNAAARVLRLRQVATSPAVLEVEGESPPDTSGKLDDVVRVVTDAGERPWVFFTWFKRSAGLLAERLPGEAHLFTGDTPPDERAELAASFQAGEFPFIVCTIKAGGTGIDLYRAADCGFVEEDWVPAENDQAFARIDRKGQKQRPQRHIWRSLNSVDTGSIAPKNATKRLITETIMGG